MLIGLVHARRWEPPDDAPEPPGDLPPVPWRTLAWIAAVVALLLAEDPVEDLLGPLAGYAVLLLAVTLGMWRVERWCARQDWGGLRDFRL